MSDSSEHELDAFGSDDDLDMESGLPTEERRKFLRKKRKQNGLDSRIAGVPPGRLSKQEKQEADKHVMRKLTVNAGLIGMWYFFSLSISLVRSQNPEHWPDTNMVGAVQQMDVLVREPQLPLPTLYHISPHGGTIPPRIDRPPHLPLPQTEH